MKNTEIMAQITFAYTQLPEDVRQDSTEAFKYVIEMLKKEIQKEGV